MSIALADQILKRLRFAMDSSVTMEGRLRSDNDDPIEMSPWAVWLLLSLVLHRDRQQFVLDCMSYRLNGSADELARDGALAHPECPTVGLVPNNTEWEYRFHGRGCAMSNRLTGVVIDVDFLDETADWITPFFYVYYLESLPDASFAEGRVHELYPTEETVELGFAELEEMGLLERHETYRAFRLTFDWRPLCELLDTIELRWKEPRLKSLVAAAISDWFMLEGEKTGAEECTLARRRKLVQLCRLDEFAVNALQAIADFDYPELDDVLRHALSDSASREMLRAVQIIKDKNIAAAYSNELTGLSRRIDPNGAAPAPSIWSTVAELLLNLKANTDLEPAFLKIQSHSLGESAILAMEHNLPSAMILIRRSLRSNIPVNRIQVASVLAIIDSNWCHKELKAVLDETIDPESTSECRSALLESRNGSVHQFVHRWEQDNPYLPAKEENHTIGEFAKQRNDATIQFEMQTLHDRIYPLREGFRPVSG